MQNANILLFFPLSLDFHFLNMKTHSKNDLSRFKLLLLL